MKRRVLVLFAAFLSLVAVSASAAVIHVPQDQPTMQQAIDAASNGDLVLVSPGIYLERINYHGKAITLQSEAGPAQTIIDGDHRGAVVTFATQEGPQSVLTGFTIRYGSASIGGGINLTFGTSPTISQNIFSENIHANGGWGSAIAGNGSSPVIERNTFVANVGDEQYLAGVLCFVNSSSPLIVNNVFHDNPSRAINLTVSSGSHPVIAHNTIVRNRLGIRLDGRGGSANQLVANNILMGNDVGIFLEFPTVGSPPALRNNLVFDNPTNYSGLGDPTGFNGNISSDPQFAATGSHFQLQSGSPAIDAGTLSIPGLPAIDFLGQSRVVDGDGNSSAVPDLGACEFDPTAPRPTPTPFSPPPSSTPTPAGIIRVPADQPSIQQAIDAAGAGYLILVSPGTYFEHIDYHGKAVAIQSTAGPEKTIIDGSYTGAVATFQTQEGSRSVLTGFTIQHGNPSFGGGIYLLGASPTITRNIFKNNGQQGGGSGAAIDGNGSSAWIEGNTFEGNTCGNQFLSGVVTFVGSSSPHLINNIFRKNPCRAINFSLPAGCAPIVAHNTIVSNRGGVRVDARFSSSFFFANNILVGNGIGLFVDSPLEGHEPRWTRNLVFSNTTNYSGIADQTGVKGNISSDPLFAPGRNDFELSPGSPAIEAGTLSVPSLPFFDFAGRSRVADGEGDGSALPDIGACEFVKDSGITLFQESDVGTRRK